MEKLSIVTWPAEVLETRAAEVSVFDDEFKQLCQAMHLTLDKSDNAVGLAANQVNVLKRVLVMHVPLFLGNEEYPAEERQWWHDKRFTLVNPRITASSGKFRVMEGCLSFPKIYDYVPRAKFVTVEAQDEEGKPISFVANDFFAVLVQHEIDHLDGIVFLTRMSRLKAVFHRKKLR